MSETQAPMVASGGAYGDRKAMEEIQGGSALAGKPALPTPPPLTAPSALPGEPVTAGANAGPGPSASDVGIMDDKQVTDEQLRPFLRSWQLLANLPGSNTETRTIVRLMKARLSRG